MKLLVITSALLLNACAICKIPEPLYRAYSVYSSQTNVDNIGDTYTHYFASSLVDGKDAASSEIKQQLLFHSYLAREFSHVEFISTGSACLTVNGFDQEAMPLSLNMAYVEAGGKWLIKNINVEFLEREGDFSQVAKCPPQ